MWIGSPGIQTSRCTSSGPDGPVVSERSERWGVSSRGGKIHLSRLEPCSDLVCRPLTGTGPADRRFLDSTGNSI